MTEVKEVISHVYSDALTGIQVLEDIRGDYHLAQVGDFSSLRTGERKYLQSIVKTHWPNDSGFHRIPDYFNPGQFLDYTVPAGKNYNIAFILASQTGNSVSTVGLFIENEIRAIGPLRDNLFYALYDPIPLPPGTHISVRFFPAGKGVELSIVVGGHLTPIEA